VKKIIPILLVIIIKLIFCVDAKSQDVEFSQFYASPLYVNAAQGGFSYAPKIVLHYRDHQPFFNRAFVTYLATYDQYIGGLHGAIGLVLQHDVAAKGLYTNQSAMFCYNYQTSINKINFSFGVGAGLIKQKINASLARFEDQINLPYGFENASGVMQNTSEQFNTGFLKPDASFGILAYSSRAFMGASVKHLVPIAWSAQNKGVMLSRKYSFNAGYEFQLKPRKPYTLTPNVLVSVQDPFTQCNVGAQIQADKLRFGAYYRTVIDNSDAAIIALSYQIGIVNLGYSYDFGLKNVNRYFTGAHELVIKMQIEESAYGKRQRRLKNSTTCPSFLK
jgi:type IX secretion system PorP/SprF family membrane protein